MALKFRRGTTAQQSGSLAFGEPYVNTTLGTLLVGGPDGDIVLSATGTGSTGNFGPISGSGLDITGDANIHGNLTLGGAITIGDASSDTVNVVASLSSSLIPSETNVFDLGSSTKIWKELYISTGSIKFTDASGNVVRTFNPSVLDALEAATGSSTTSITQLFASASDHESRVDSLEAFSSSLDGGFVNNAELAAATGALESVNTTQNGRLSSLESFSGSQLSKDSALATYTASVDSKFSTLATYTGSNDTTNTTQNTRLTALEASASTALSTNNTQATSITNLNSFTSSINTTIKSKLDTDGVISGSSQVTISSTTGYTTFSSSLDSRINTEKGRVDAILASADANYDTFAEIVTLINSVDTTNDNAFASFYTSSNATNTAQDARLSALETETGSIATAQTTQNTRLTALEVSASTALSTNNTQATSITNLNSTTASLNTSVTNLNSYTSSFAAASVTLTNKTISGASNTLSNIANASLTNSAITIAGSSTSLGGSISAATILGAGSTTNLSEGTNLYYTDARVKTKLNAEGVISGSSQISLSGFSTSNLSEGSNLYYTDARVKTKLNAETVISGSSQVFANVSGDITIASNGVATIAANSVALGTDTTGNYVGTITAGTGVSTTGASTGEGIAHTISIGQSVATSATPTFAGLTINGSITATGDITAYYSSDRRFKSNIELIPNALAKVSKLNGVTWTWNDDVNEVTKSTPNTGLIAQEVQEVLPEVVMEREDGHLGLDYSKMVGLLVEAIKEQDNKIYNLTLQIEELKKQKGL